MSWMCGGVCFSVFGVCGVCVCVSLYPLTGHYMRTETNLPSSKAVFQALASLANLAATQILFVCVCVCLYPLKCVAVY